jgi:hypothetical protein
MDGDKEFAHALADFLALHTEQSPGYLFHLIRTFLRGAAKLPRLEAAEKKQIINRLTAKVAAHNNVPSFFQSCLLSHLQQKTWPPSSNLLRIALSVPVKRMICLLAAAATAVHGTCRGNVRRHRAWLRPDAL